MVFNFFNVLPIAYALSLGLFVNLLFSLNLEMSIAISTLVVALYSLNGGFRSVVYTDIIQFPLSKANRFELHFEG